jgi:hypothetical protein
MRMHELQSSLGRRPLIGSVSILFSNKPDIRPQPACEPQSAPSSAQDRPAGEDKSDCRDNEERSAAAVGEARVDEYAERQHDRQRANHYPSTCSGKGVCSHQGNSVGPN